MLTVRLPKRRERGQVVVLFALLVPVILTIGSLVVSAGNWYVLKRHLQTQADAAALASGPEFIGCGQGPTEVANANAQTRAEALRFSGDTQRNQSSTFNLQLEESGDQRAVINSTDYWNGGDTQGAGYDFTLGLPCDTKFVDVKITDDRAPLLFKWIPLFPSPKARARVEAHEIIGTEGVRPLGVPEVEPERVAVLIVNELATTPMTNPAAIVNPTDQRFLDHKIPAPTGFAGAGIEVWSKDLQHVGLAGGSQNFSVVVVASRDPGVSVSGSLQAICTQNPTQTHCYSGASALSGISFIHTYNVSGSGTAANPIVRDVSLSGGCGVSVTPPARDSNPYFNVDDGTSCAGIGISATIDFGTGANDPRDPTAQGGVCAEVTASPFGNLSYAGGGVWTGAWTPALGSGDNPTNLTIETDVNGGCNGGNVTTTVNRVANPYVSDDASGPVQFLTLENLNTGLLANSMAKDPDANIRVTVGLTPPLRDALPTDPPIPLRVWNTPSQTQALDCGSGAGPNGWAGKMQEGCDAYQIYDQLKHQTGCGPPPTGVPAADPPDCIASQNGNFQQSVVTDMWASPCGDTPNNWYTAVNNFEAPKLDDPRWIPLFIVDETAFTQSGKKYYPIRRFGGFYVTAGSGMNCPGDDPPGNLSGKRTLYGHFVSYIIPTFGDVIPSDDLCSFTDGGACVVSLVE